MKKYQDKVAVITGAASGIGKALAEKCAKKQMKIVLADIDAESLFALEKELKCENTNIISIVTDVTKLADIRHLARVTLDKFKNVHLLFNNAGIVGPIGPIWDIEIQDIEHLLQVNLMGVIYGVREFIPLMLKQKDESHIINTASAAGLHTSANTLAYNASKHAVVALSEVLYYDLQARNSHIKVSVLCPGSVNTSIVNKLEINPRQSTHVNKVIESLRKQLKEGMSPQQVADQTFKAISSDQFYILTHLDHKELIQKRMEDILQIRAPSRTF